MKRYLYILFVGALLSLTSCVMDETMNPGVSTPGAEGGFQFIAIAEDFDKHNVGTRAEGDKVSDSYITEMTMLIFRNDGKLLPAFDTNQQALPSSHINIDKPNPTFLINANKYDGTGILASMEDGISLMYYDNKAKGIDKCRIYIVANAYHLIGERLESGKIQSIDDLNAALVDTNASLSMPHTEDNQPIGLPMIGTHGDETFDLTYGGTGKNAIATIPLKKLYSKICFRMQVNSNQIVANGPTPKFTIDRAEVYNVPSKIRMGYANGDYVDNVENPQYLYTSEPHEIKEFKNNKTTIYHSSSVTTNDVIEFEFYMPEHKVTPLDITYPWDAEKNEEFEDYRQYFKPKGVSGSEGGVPTTKIAPFVRICGTYYDHNGQIKDVSYDIYLGQNEYNDFEIKRNQQLNNYITITGLTNHKYAYGKDETNISVDHRVTMSNKGYHIYMEREAILDAHFEVRPIDIELQKGSYMTITIPETYRKWIAMESDEVARANNATNNYVSNTENMAVRRYFTTDLVSELEGANGGQVRIPDKGVASETKTYRVWFYVDENPNVYDKTGATSPNSDTDGTTYSVSKTLYRNAPVTFKFSGIASDDPNSNVDSAETTINFQQWNLWRVWSADGKRYYDIEHEEEYLNNYASDMPYDSKQDGMPWGLDGIQLSNIYPAACLTLTDSSWITDLIGKYGGYIGMSSVEDMARASYNQIETFYDFYLLRDVASLTENQQNELEVRSYSGLTFNEEIAETLKTSSDSNAKIEGILLTEDPKSAFAYCYHKNKRNSDGYVVDQKWFLPAIDEIEDIALGAYDEFDKVFQNQKYWSCQPAYDIYKLNIIFKVLGISFGTLTADYYNDNLSRARATSVYTTDGKNYLPLLSGAPAYSGTQNGRATLDNKGSFLKPNYGLAFNMTQEGGYIKNEIPVSTYEEKVPGNLPRTEKCRIRAVYRSGTK